MIEEIKNKIDIVEFINGYVPLRRAGSYYRGLCPFHSEKSPSFFVSGQKQIWKCFGCGEGGDAIAFFLKIEKLEFKEGIKILAERFGLELNLSDQADQAVRTKLLALNQLALEFFQSKLQENQLAIAYLLKRGLSRETIEQFRLGYAPFGSGLRDFLLKKGKAINEIEAAGFLNSRREDRFQGRIIFPFVNQFGRLVGFTGRTLKETENTPKYLNSSETILFKKSQFVYGLFESLDEIKKKKEAVLVEGQMDWLLAFQAGLKNIVALSGTALTEDQVKLLKRFCQKVIFALDEDEAGLKATLRSALLFLRADFELGKLDFGQSNRDQEKPIKDLGDFFGQGFGLAELNQLPLLDYLFNLGLKKFDLSQVIGRKAMIEFFLPQLKLLNPAEAQLWLTRLSEQTRVAEPLLLSELKKIKIEEWFQPAGIGSVNGSTGVNLNLGAELGDRQSILAERFLALVLVLKRQAILESYRDYLEQKKDLVGKIINQTDIDDEEVEVLRLRGEYEKDSKGLNQALENEFDLIAKELKKDYFHRRIELLRQSLKLAQADEVEKILVEAENYSKKINELEKSTN